MTHSISFEYMPYYILGISALCVLPRRVFFLQLSRLVVIYSSGSSTSAILSSRSTLGSIMPLYCCQRKRMVFLVIKNVFVRIRWWHSCEVVLLCLVRNDRRNLWLRVLSESHYGVFERDTNFGGCNPIVSNYFRITLQDPYRGNLHR